MSTPDERELGGSYSEFLGAMQYLSEKTQQELADYTGIKITTLGRHIRGDTVPQYTSRLAIEKAFELTPDETDHLHNLSLDERRAKRSSDTPVTPTVDPQLQSKGPDVAALAEETLETVLDTMEQRPLAPVEGLLGIAALGVLRDLSADSS